MPEIEQNASSMAVRAAWLHYAGGHTQAEVARKLGLTSLKAHRLITKANNEGLVKVYIDGDVAECVALETLLSDEHQLTYCEVVPDLDESELPLRALGIAGAQYLKRVIEDSEHESIGIGHGRTLASCVNFLPRIHRPNKQIVSLLGGFSKKFSANPHDVIHLMAQRTEASAYVMPVPFFANTVEDKKVIMQQAGINEVMQLARETSIKIAGIGCVDVQSSMVANSMLEKKEILAVQEAGGRGEVLGHFFDADGQLVDTELSERTMGLTSNDLTNTNIMAVAGGDTKVQAILSILKSGLLSGLITDESTARALVDYE
ncbi:MAG: sugar-binding transcriptional regulator [Granulosicoccus sp.]